MTIRFDDTIVHAKDKIASAEFFAEIFQLDGQAQLLHAGAAER